MDRLRSSRGHDRRVSVRYVFRNGARTGESCRLTPVAWIRSCCESGTYFPSSRRLGREHISRYEIRTAMSTVCFVPDSVAGVATLSCQIPCDRSRARTSLGRPLTPPTRLIARETVATSGIVLHSPR
jgi:hypothetical protein